MFMSDMTLMRDTNDGPIGPGNVIASCNAPSVRIRTRTTSGMGSMCTSDARARTAVSRIRLTTFTTGAFSSTTVPIVCSVSLDVWRATSRASNMRSASPRSVTDAYILLMTASMSVPVANTSRTGTPSFAMSSSCRDSARGSATATSRRRPSRAIGTAPQSSRVVLREERDDLAIQLHVAELDDVDLQLLGQHSDEHTLAQQAQLDEDVAEALAGTGLGHERFPELLLGYETAVEEELTEGKTDVSGSAFELFLGRWDRLVAGLGDRCLDARGHGRLVLVFGSGPPAEHSPPALSSCPASCPAASAPRTS